MKVFLASMLLAGGAVVVYGGITGRLAPMLAALFVPGDLVGTGNTTGATNASTSVASGDIQSTIINTLSGA